jgi:hypothetical protein
LGIIIFLLGCLVIWESKQQQLVTLSSPEAEYVALSGAPKELKFVAQTLESIGNFGAIFLLENVTATK